MIENELNILQNIVNDHANAVQRAELQTAAAALHDTGTRSIQGIQHHYGELLQANDDLEEEIRSLKEALEDLRSKRVSDTAG